MEIHQRKNVESAEYVLKCAATNGMRSTLLNRCEERKTTEREGQAADTLLTQGARYYGNISLAQVAGVGREG